MTGNAGPLTLEVPFAIRKRSGRKEIVTPDGMPALVPPRVRIDSALVKALGRAFRWRKLLETGVHGTVDELARAERINASYVSRVLRLTLLAPEIIEAVLDGRQPEGMTLAGVMAGVPVVWDGQIGSHPLGC
jgi:hypothetical protein